MKKPHEDIYGFFNEYRWLSNFYPLEKPIDVYGCLFNTTENLYQAFKCNKEEDFLTMSTISAGQAKRLGKVVELNPEFEANKLSIMESILLLKFEQPYFRKRLLSTGNCHIEESNNWGDVYWGTVGGFGENNLGKIIMKIRDNLS